MNETNPADLERSVLDWTVMQQSFVFWVDNQNQTQQSSDLSLGENALTILPML